MLIAAGTIDLHLEPKRGYLAKCREGQSVEHARDEAKARKQSKTKQLFAFSAGE
jgi:hypothetical protein